MRNADVIQEATVVTITFVLETSRGLPTISPTVRAMGAAILEGLRFAQVNTCDAGKAI